MHLSRLNGPNSVLPIIDTFVARKHPRTVFIINGEIKTYPCDSLSEARCLKNQDAVMVGTYDAGADARRLYEDIQASLPQNFLGHRLVLGTTRSGMNPNAELLHQVA